MRWLTALFLLAACGDPLKHDVEMFCNATVGSNWKWFMDVAPYAMEHAKTDEFKELLMHTVHSQTDIWQFADKVRELMKRTGVERCRTLDDIVRPKPVQ
jgi:hypothetical protein